MSCPNCKYEFTFNDEDLGVVWSKYDYHVHIYRCPNCGKYVLFAGDFWCPDIADTYDEIMESAREHIKIYEEIYEEEVLRHPPRE